MCERYFLNTPPADLRRHFGVKGPVEELARAAAGHILPGQMAPVVLNEGGYSIRQMRWGFLHACTEDPKDGFKTSQIDAESVVDKRDFSIPLRYRRCLVPSDAFYVPRVGAGASDLGLARFRAKEGKPFAMAGIWNVWNPVGKPPVFTFAVLTIGAGTAQPHVGRLALLLDAPRQALWLSGLSDPDELRSLLLPGKYRSIRNERSSEEISITAHSEQMAAMGT